MMSAVTMPTILSNGHVNGKLENGLNGYRKNGYVKQELSDSAVSILIMNRFF